MPGKRQPCRILELEEGYKFAVEKQLNRLVEGGRGEITEFCMDHIVQNI